MARTHRPRRFVTAALTAAIGLALAACAGDYPNTTFNHTTEFNEAIDYLWDRLLFFGTIVFLIVEIGIVYAILKFRHRPGQKDPKHVHGNTTLEIIWTVIPALILVFIAIPTVRTIFRTQAKAVPSALQVEVVGHQWWWEFRYPQYTTRTPAGRLDTLTTANELYLPAGRTVNFALRTADVLHSFWIPRLGGKRDLIANHTNYLWMTPRDSMTLTALNGSCNEYCGASHANMRFRTFVVSPAQFASWAAHQATPAAFGAVAPPAPAAPAGGSPAAATTPAGATVALAATQGGAGSPAPNAAPNAAAEAPGFVFPKDKLPAYVVPSTPTPAGLTFPKGLRGDPTRGQKIYSSSACIACHLVGGNPASVGRIGPNLTHVGSRYTIAGALYPNDPYYMALWIKNARAMKPGSLMPTLGKNQVDPTTKQTVTAGGLDDQQIADIVAYLEALK